MSPGHSGQPIQAEAPAIMSGVLMAPGHSSHNILVMTRGHTMLVSLGIGKRYKNPEWMLLLPGGTGVQIGQ